MLHNVGLKGKSLIYLFTPGHHHLNGVSLEGRWWPNIEGGSGLVTFRFHRGSGPVLLKPIFCDFRWDPDILPPPSGSAHEPDKNHLVHKGFNFYLEE